MSDKRSQNALNKTSEDVQEYISGTRPVPQKCQEEIQEIHLETGDALEVPLHLTMPSFDIESQDCILETRGVNGCVRIYLDTFGHIALLCV